MPEYKQFYRRKLPHIHSPDATLFVTFRLAGTIPKSVVNRYQNEREFVEHHASKEGDDERSAALKEFHRAWFRKFEDILDKEESGPVWLKNTEVATMLADGFLYRNGKDFDLKAFCLMSNHVHTVFRPYLSMTNIHESKTNGRTTFHSSEPTLGMIMQSLKGYTARKANLILGRPGQFWESESYDHEIGSPGEFRGIVKYVLNNPVKAGIVDNWREYKFTWLADDLQADY